MTSYRSLDCFLGIFFWLIANAFCSPAKCAGISFDNNLSAICVTIGCFSPHSEGEEIWWKQQRLVTPWSWSWSCIWYCKLERVTRKWRATSCIAFQRPIPIQNCAFKISKRAVGKLRCGFGDKAFSGVTWPSPPAPASRMIASSSSSDQFSPRFCIGSMHLWWSSSGGKMWYSHHKKPANIHDWWSEQALNLQKLKKYPPAGPEHACRDGRE